jgi:hypothetical protein
MKQAISFSLYGSDLRYCVGAIKNAIIAQEILDEEYDLIFFVGQSVPSWVVSTLRLFPNVQIIQTDAPEDHTAKLWRFLACELDYDFVGFRDADARLSLRELNAHEEFIESGLDAHIMKDHPIGHNYPINAGMFTVRSALFKDIRTLIESAEISDYYTQDQDFLRNLIYPRIQFSCFVHDEFYETGVEGKSIRKPYLLEPVNQVSHIGAALDENDRFIFTVDQQKSVALSGDDKYLYEWGQ